MNWLGAALTFGLLAFTEWAWAAQDYHRYCAWLRRQSPFGGIEGFEQVHHEIAARGV